MDNIYNTLRKVIIELAKYYVKDHDFMWSGDSYEIPISAVTWDFNVRGVCIYGDDRISVFVKNETDDCYTEKPLQFIDTETLGILIVKLTRFLTINN